MGPLSFQTTMFIPFDTLPDTARLWVYPASRPLSDADVTLIEQQLEPALQGWTAHGQPLMASARVVANRFILIAVDGGFALPSGCSIDASVGMLRSLSEQLTAQSGAVDFFDRSAMVQTESGGVTAVALPAIKAAVSSGQLRPDTVVFNTLVQTVSDFRTGWQIPAEASWLKRYFRSVGA